MADTELHLVSPGRSGGSGQPSAHNYRDSHAISGIPPGRVFGKDGVSNLYLPL